MSFITSKLVSFLEYIYSLVFLMIKKMHLCQMKHYILCNTIHSPLFSNSGWRFTYCFNNWSNTLFLQRNSHDSYLLWNRNYDYVYYILCQKNSGLALATSVRLLATIDLQCQVLTSFIHCILSKKILVLSDQFESW
jgi:hypothetical protein